jgi:hypothetical protein
VSVPSGINTIDLAAFFFFAETIIDMFVKYTLGAGIGFVDRGATGQLVA